MATTGARSDDHGAKWLATDLLRERFRYLERHLIFFAQRAKSPCHTTAGGVEHGHVAFRQPFCETHHKIWFHQGFHMAVRVNYYLACFGFETERGWLLVEQIGNKAIE